MTQSDEYDTIKEVVWKKVRLNITPKEFKQLSKWSENIYNTAVIIDYFVDNQPDESKSIKKIFERKMI